MNGASELTATADFETENQSQETCQQNNRNNVSISKAMGKLTTTQVYTNRTRMPTQPFTNCEAKFVKQFDVSVASDKNLPVIWSSAFLPDSRLLLVDTGNNKLKMFDKNYKFMLEKQLSKTLEFVSVFDNSEVSLLADDKTITRLSAEKGIRVKGTIDLGFCSRSIGYISKDRLAVTSSGEYPDFFCIFSTSGAQLSKTSKDLLGCKLFVSPFYVTVNRSKPTVYIADMVNGCVSGLDLSLNYKRIFNYKHDALKIPHGVELDREGNVYICGYHDHNIHQISPRGVHLNILLSEEDGVKHPRTMSFSPSGETFIVGSLYRNTVQVFRMEDKAK